MKIQQQLISQYYVERDAIALVYGITSTTIYSKRKMG
jgi:hypothetical protein